MITTHEVKAYIEEYICDKCQKGKMLTIGTIYTSNPPKYPHKCDSCGEEIILLEQYPHIIYLEQ